MLRGGRYRIESGPREFATLAARRGGVNELCFWGYRRALRGRVASNCQIGPPLPTHSKRTAPLGPFCFRTQLHPSVRVRPTEAARASVARRDKELGLAPSTLSSAVPSIHPYRGVGTGGRTYKRPTSPQTLHRTRIGERRSLWPAASMAARLSTIQRSQGGQGGGSAGSRMSCGASAGFTCCGSERPSVLQLQRITY